MNEHSELTSDALARAAQTLAVSISVVEALARARAQRAHDRADDAERALVGARATEALNHSTARLTWTPAFDDHTLRRLSATEMLQAWEAADQYRNLDPSAARAAELIEQRLRGVHPEAMAVYDDALDQGRTAADAMQQAKQRFRGEFGLEPPGATLRLGQSTDDLRHAYSATRTDDPTTALVDEGTWSQVSARRYFASAAAAQARALTDLAMPVSIEQAMTTAPQAAKRMRALPAAPTRAHASSPTPEPAGRP